MTAKPSQPTPESAPSPVALAPRPDTAGIWYRRIVTMVATILMPLGLMVAGDAVPQYGVGIDDFTSDDAVGVTDVDPGGVEFSDPSADQVWTEQDSAWPEAERHTFGLDSDGMQWPENSVVGLRASQAGSGDVTVDVHSQAVSRNAGINGLVVQVEGSADASVELSVAYGDFSRAYGAGWGSRLQLTELADCDPATTDDRCRAEVVPTRNDVVERTVSADIDLAEGETATFAVTTTSNGTETGDYAATDLDPIGSWEAGGNDGSFGYSIPISVPPADGPEPQISLGYSSASHDGRTSGRNNQASWIGDGWSYDPGYIERSYTACASDHEGNANNDETDFTGDQCWDGDSNHLTVSLNGTNATILKDDDSGDWYVDSGVPWKIELLGSPASNSSSTTERWRITTDDGSQFEFGFRSSSRLTMPVFGNHPGEPCHASQFENSSCAQTYRWLLDSGVDTLENKIEYRYSTRTGHYGAAGDADNRTSYVRESWLTRIDYGLRADDSSVPATGRIVFDVSDRCESSCTNSGRPNEDNWPEVPWDLNCFESPCTTQLSPAFFSTKKLDTITTQVREGSSYRDITTWKLEHEFKDYGDEEQVVLWLKSIQQTAGSNDMPPLEFGGMALPNRVDAIDGAPQIWRWRLTDIKTETGAVISVNYSEPQCTSNNRPSSAHNNSMRCYPVKWTPPEFSEPEEDYFHKYVVTDITEADQTTENVAVYTAYEYSTSGGGTSVLWGWDDSAFTDDDDRTWGVWKGYSQVTTYVGDPQEGDRQRTRARYYRGLHGDNLPSGTRSVNVTDAEGNSVRDHRALGGQLFESLTYNGGQIIDGHTTRFWTSKVAEQDHDGGSYAAWRSGPNREESRRWLTGSNWQRSRVDTTYDSLGRPASIHDYGDLSESAHTCVRLTYADNPSANIFDLPRTEEKVAVGCDATPQKPGDVLASTRHYYDESNSLSAAPTKGLPTRYDVLDEWPEDGSASYVTTEATEYDSVGRVLSVTDAMGRTTATAFTPSGPGPVTRTDDTNAAGHTSQTHFDPAWGQATKIVDANGRETVIAYDAFGRTADVWLPGRSSSRSPSLRFEYRLRDDAPSAVITRELNTGNQYVTSVELYDSLLRLRQTQTHTADNGRVLTEIWYDSHGRVEEELGPNHNASPPTDTLVRVEPGASRKRVTYHYDAAGRITDEVLYNRHVEKWRTTTTYGGDNSGFRVATTPPEGGSATATIENAIGQLLESRTYHSRTPTGDFDALTYSYNTAGDLVEMNDPAGNAWTWGYDLRGRQISSVDPDAGESVTAYDAAGQTTSVTDARGISLHYQYDELGRLIERRDGEGELLASWEFDTVPGGIGLPGTNTRYVDGAEYAERVLNYDAGGRATQVEMVIPAEEGALAGTYLTTQMFFDNGQMQFRGYGAVAQFPNEGLQYAHDPVGNVVWMNSVMEGQYNVVIDHARWSPYGEVLTRRIGSNAGKQMWHGFVYDETTRRIERIGFGHDTNKPVIGDSRYTYDDYGNVLSIAEHAESAPERWERQCFEYDSQQRLVEAWAQEDLTECAESGAQATLGGPAPYWNNYHYDSAGNRTSDTLRLPGRDVEERAFHYPSAGESQPHAPTHVDINEDGKAVFGYDEAGNTTSRDIDGDVQIFDYDAEGNVVAVHEGDNLTRSVYDIDGERLIRDDGETATLFLPDTEVVWDKVTGSLEATRFYTHAGHLVASSKSSQRSEWTFYGVDPAGTATHMINAQNHNDARVRYFDPFGNQRGEKVDWVGQRGFVGGIQDPTGLTLLGARDYDPLFGRFMSVDEVINILDDQQINGYAYANHSPITFADPTGMFLGLVDKAKSVGKNVANTVTDAATSASNWVQDNAGTIAQVAGTVATVAAFVPGGQVVAAAAGAVAIGAGAIETAQSCSSGDTVGCAMGAASMVPGVRTATDVGSKAFTCATGSAADCASEFIPGGRRGPKATDGGGTGGSGGPASCSTGRKSFLPGTLVVTADGATKPIEDIAPGEQVLAVDPVTGELTAGSVSVTHTTPDQERDLVDITVAPLDEEQSGASGASETITATVGHPFWAPDVDEWVPARNLEAGSWLQTSSGTWAQVEAVEHRSETVTTHNLTVAGVHTYFVQSEQAELLTHNQGSSGGCDDPLQSYAESVRNEEGNRFAAEFTSPSGNTYYGRNNNDPLHPDVRAAQEKHLPAYEKGCAEMHCVSNALNSGDSVQGGNIRVVHTTNNQYSQQRSGHGHVASPCRVCKAVLGDLMIAVW
ncbi:polymorphic toxin-type HINT domain-containing protein [Natronoglycomyces albus]|uniref:Hint domain-containing protein n=1 Tax=Natronoglycomyces albus TaxID=2811108 RepID=A0A895XNF3_9ACTN|nr:polymorphic toxin-type HINT domain-containing protein [Natronoglycomyces albus]QSB05073.1 hypothetical protein JQS30_15140 [Natronoglycomyces albus]